MIIQTIFEKNIGMKRITNIISVLSRRIAEIEGSIRKGDEFDNLTITQIYYLETIAKLVNPSVTELSAELKLTKATVSVNIDKLVEKSYVERVQSDADRRMAHIHLTRKGEKINVLHDEAHNELANIFAQNLNKTEMDILCTLLEKALMKNS